MDGSVFPQPEGPRNQETGRSEYAPEFGLTKRELFAAMAMQGLAASEADGQQYAHPFGGMAERAVGMADALLAELAK